MTTKLRPKHTWYSNWQALFKRPNLTLCGALQERLLVSAALATALQHYNEPRYDIKFTQEWRKNCPTTNPYIYGQLLNYKKNIRYIYFAV